MLPATNNCSQGKLPHANSNADGFFLDWRCEASAKVYLYKLHPRLTDWTWFVSTIVFFMKLQRTLMNFFASIWWEATRKEDEEALIRSKEASVRLDD